MSIIKNEDLYKNKYQLDILEQNIMNLSCKTTLCVIEHSIFNS